VAGPPSIFRLLSRVSIDMRPLVLSSVGAGPIDFACAGGSAPGANLHVASGS
jgi:hypothetical protein